MKTSLPFLGWVRAAGLFLCLSQNLLAAVLTNSTPLEPVLDKYRDRGEELWQVKSRGKRAISEADMHLILDLHNKLRGQVYPPASNMEYMVSDGGTASCLIVLAYVLSVKIIQLCVECFQRKYYIRGHIHWRKSKHIQICLSFLVIPMDYITKYRK